MKKNLFLTTGIVLGFLFTGAAGFAQGSRPIPDVWRYFGEVPPGKSPVMFAPGTISDGMSNRDMAVSPVGDELFYTIQGPRGNVSCIIYTHFVSGAWTKPEVADFSGVYSDLEAAFSADGRTIYFASNRPAESTGTRGGIVETGKGNAMGKAREESKRGAEGPAMVRDNAPKDFDIWVVRKDNLGKWTRVERLDTVINSARDEYYPSVARNGNLYFTREMENGKGNEDIVMSEWKDGKYQRPYSLPEAINSDKGEFNAFVDPDEQFLLFSSYGRADDLGDGDLYLSIRDKKGEWQPAVHLDSTINSRNIDFCPYVTPDKKYFFFTSGKVEIYPPFRKPLNFQFLKQLLQGPGNGLTDIYWMDWRSFVNKYFHGS